MHSEPPERVGSGIEEGVDPLRVGAGLAVSAVLVAVLAAVVGPVRLFGLLRTGDPVLLAVAAGAAVAGLLLRGWAASVLYTASGAPPVDARFYLLYAFAVLPKHFMPGGHAAGPVITAYALARDSGGRFEATLASFALAELVNLVASLAVAAAGASLLVVLAAGTPLRGVATVLAGVVLLATLSTAAVLVLRSDDTGRVLVRSWAVLGVTVARIPPARHLRRLVVGRVAGRGAEFARTARSVSDDRRAVSGSFAVAGAAALVSAAPLYFCLAAIDAPASVPVVLVVAPVAGLVSLTPLPGGIGGVELAMAGLLVALGGLDPGVAGATTVLYRLSTFGVITLTGAVAAGVLTASGGRPTAP